MIFVYSGLPSWYQYSSLCGLLPPESYIWYNFFFIQFREEKKYFKSLLTLYKSEEKILLKF